MNRRIVLWMLFGFMLACCWVVVAALVPHTYNLGFWMREHWTVAAITAPASLLGQRMPLSAVWFVLLNGGVYAMTGLTIELLRRSYHSAIGR